MGVINPLIKLHNCCASCSLAYLKSYIMIKSRLPIPEFLDSQFFNGFFYLEYLLLDRIFYCIQVQDSAPGQENYTLQVKLDQQRERTYSRPQNRQDKMRMEQVRRREGLSSVEEQRRRRGQFLLQLYQFPHREKRNRGIDQED